MPQRSKITALPPAVKTWLDQALIAANFAQYEQLEKLLREQGYTIGKSSIHRYGSNLERKLAAIKASTEAASLIAAAAPDDADERAGAVISMIQTEVFGVLVTLQDAESTDDPMKRAKLLSAVAKNVATLTRASIAQKQHAIAIRAKVAAAADEARKLAKKGGASDAVAKQIWQAVTGIAP
jgi:hypothetical protein